jgi:hypothetical protein
MYSVDKFEKEFGWKEGAYTKSTTDKLMPNIAIYCNATVCYKSRMKVHVINLIGCALDSTKQPDWKYFSSRTDNDLIVWYTRMWRKALACAIELKQRGEIHAIKLFNVGGGAFSGKYGDSFTKKIFEKAFSPLIHEFNDRGIQILGYTSKNGEFNGGFIPQTLLTDSDMEHILYVNAWDPWSLIGNGNSSDNSLDGFWGRCSNMAVLGWSLTNPYIQYRSVI